MENKIIKCISLDIYEDKQIGNCSNDGISNRFNDVLIPCEDGYITVDLDNPPENLCKVVKDTSRGLKVNMYTLNLMQR